MDVLMLIDKLDDLVHNAKQVRLRDRVRVDREEVYDILDQMRATIPDDVRQARWIVKERQEMLSAAQRKAQRMVAGAGERQTQLVRQHELTRKAERAAEEILDGARAREREIRLGAEDYADEILDTLEVNLSRFIAVIRRGRERLQGPDEPANVGKYEA
jgi:cell division septum initiation protein DivIVA